MRLVRHEQTYNAISSRFLEKPIHVDSSFISLGSATLCLFVVVLAWGFPDTVLQLATTRGSPGENIRDYRHRLEFDINLSRRQSPRYEAECYGAGGL